MNIRKLNKDEKLPMELLLLADPSEEIVKEYAFMTTPQKTSRLHKMQV